MSTMKDKQKWLRLDDEDWQIVIPDIDIKPHGILKVGELKVELAGRECPCNPKINWEDKIIVHNSFQDIEKIEKSLKNIF